VAQVAGLFVGGSSVRIELPDGYYVGTSPDGKIATGNGKRFWNADSLRIYEGDLVLGKCHGQGKGVSKTGKIYNGTWRNDNYHGEGFRFFYYLLSLSFYELNLIPIQFNYSYFAFLECVLVLHKYSWVQFKNLAWHVLTDNQNTHAIGVLLEVDGIARYDGYWNNNKKQGKGIIVLLFQMLVIIFFKLKATPFLKFK
jgi:hypothetical protein